MKDGAYFYNSAARKVAWLAQSVERETLNLKAAGSSPALGFFFCSCGYLPSSSSSYSVNLVGDLFFSAVARFRERSVTHSVGSVGGSVVPGYADYACANLDWCVEVCL